jgi:AmiR/NasT family two-component response regulator
VLRRKLADRTVIERAKGRLMASHGLSEDDAFRWLRTRAMATRSTLGDVARDVTENGAAAATLSSADGSARYSQVPMV